MFDWKIDDLFVVKHEYRSMGRFDVPDPNGVGFTDEMNNEIVWKVRSLCEHSHKLVAESVDEWGNPDDRWTYYFDKSWIEPFDRDDDGKGLIDG